MIIFWFITHHTSSFCAPSAFRSHADSYILKEVCPTYLSAQFYGWIGLHCSINTCKLRYPCCTTAVIHSSVLWIYIKCLCIFRSTAVSKERRHWPIEALWVLVQYPIQATHPHRTKNHSSKRHKRMRRHVHYSLVPLALVSESRNLVCIQIHIHVTLLQSQVLVVTLFYFCHSH